MANDLKGEVEFQAGDKTYKLRFTTNALYEHLEKPLGQSFDEIIKLFDSGGVNIGLLRQLLYAGMAQCREGMTVADAGDIIDEIGWEGASLAITQGMTAAFNPGGAKKKQKAKPKK